VTFSIYGERGSIDIVAWHPGRRALPIIEPGGPGGRLRAASTPGDGAVAASAVASSVALERVACVAASRVRGVKDWQEAGGLPVGRGGWRPCVAASRVRGVKDWPETG
jgi:hypothetical protein